jgi:S1-C subfamily serine protease
MSGARLLAVAAAVGAMAVGAFAGILPGHATPPRAFSVSADGSSAPEFASGFAAGGDRVVTVAHVLDAGRTVTVDGRSATVVRVDRRDDLALLSVPGLNADSIRTGAAEIGPVRLLARPARVRRTFTAVVRVDPTTAPSRRPALDLDAAVAAGASGAPVIGRDGRVVGVVFAASRDRGHTAYAVDGSAVAALLRR